jgi:thermostable 8-oxoguanine DNA glycosylase
MKTISDRIKNQLNFPEKLVEFSLLNRYTRDRITGENVFCIFDAEGNSIILSRKKVGDMTSYKYEGEEIDIVGVPLNMISYAGETKVIEFVKGLKKEMRPVFLWSFKYGSDDYPEIRHHLCYVKEEKIAKILSNFEERYYKLTEIVCE